MTIRMGLVAALLLGLAPGAIPARADDKALANAKARAQAARKVYEGMLKRGVVDPNAALDPEKQYHWSRRWMEAEQELSGKKADRIAAFQRHLERMKKVESLVKELRKAGLVDEATVAAAEFFRLETEKLLAQTKAK